MEEEKIFNSTTAFLCLKGDLYETDLSSLRRLSAVTLGKYGRMRKTYLKAHKPIVYNTLLLSGKLTAHLVSTDAECRERLEILLPQMMQVEGVDEALKARDQMEWVRRMNSIQNRAEEILLNELVYA